MDLPDHESGYIRRRAGVPVCREQPVPGGCPRLSRSSAWSCPKTKVIHQGSGITMTHRPPALWLLTSDPFLSVERVHSPNP